MRKPLCALITGLLLSALLAPVARAEDLSVIKVGIIGLDTSHCVAFTQILNNPEATGDLAGVRVVAAYPGGSADIPESHDRVEGYTSELKGMGVEIVDSIEALLPKVDVVLLESLDGRPKLSQVRPVLEAKKPVFIDKPLAASLSDVVEILRLARELDVPCFSSSALRFGHGLEHIHDDPKIGNIVGCEARGPATLEPHHPDLYWYGIHGVETLFTIMGPECVSVTRVHTGGTDLVVGVWKDGRIGTFRGLRDGTHFYGARVYGEKGSVECGNYDGYEPLVAAIAKFFKSRKPPVTAEETIAIYAFMEAADESKREGGYPVKIEAVLAKAKTPAPK